MVHISCLYDPAVYYTPKELGEKDMYKHFLYHMTFTQSDVLNLVTSNALCYFKHL